MADSSSFLKKRTKKLLHCERMKLRQCARQGAKVFASFFKKKRLLASHRSMSIVVA